MINTLTCETQKTSPLFRNRSSTQRRSKHPIPRHSPSSFTGDGQGAPGRRLEWSRPITTHGHSHHYHVAALRALFFDSFHQENTSWWFAATIAHPPTGWRASAVKTVWLRTRTDGRSSRGQSCSCGWVTVSSRHSRAQHQETGSCAGGG